MRRTTRVQKDTKDSVRDICAISISEARADDGLVLEEVNDFSDDDEVEDPNTGDVCPSQCRATQGPRGTAGNNPQGLHFRCSSIR